MFIFLLRISWHSNVCEKFDFGFTDFRKEIACLCVIHTAQISPDFVVYMEIYLGKDIGKTKGRNPVKKCTFYQYHGRSAVLHPPKICMKCFLLTNTACQSNIKHHILLKAYENWCPYDNHPYSTCERMAKLNKEILGKIKNPSKNDRRGCPSLLKFGQ